jgi:hypothetical protein
MSQYEHPGINNSSDLAKKYGIVSKDGSFMSFYRASGEPQVAFKLRGSDEDHQILSGTPYEIGIVLVPDFYRNSQDPEEDPDAIKKNRLTVTVTYIENDDPIKEKTTANLKWTNPETMSTTSYIDYQGQKVDTLWMDDILTFPYSYRNLPKAYPTIKIASNRITSSLQKQGYQTRFNVDRIILRPKQSNEE